MDVVRLLTAGALGAVVGCQNIVGLTDRSEGPGGSGQAGQDVIAGVRSEGGAGGVSEAGDDTGGGDERVEHPTGGASSVGREAGAGGSRTDRAAAGEAGETGTARIDSGGPSNATGGEGSGHGGSHTGGQGATAAGGTGPTGGIGPSGGATGAGGAQSGRGGAGGASCDNVTPCGGDVVGTWRVTSSCLQVTGELDLVLVSIGCKSAPVTGSLQVTGTWSAKSDGTYEDNTITSGDEQLTLTADCLYLSGTTTTCQLMSVPLSILGYASVTCTDAASGGCDCTGTVDQTGGIGVVSWAMASSGTFTTSGNMIITGDETTYSYCISGNTMTMSPQSTKTGTVTGTVVFQKQQLQTRLF